MRLIIEGFGRRLADLELWAPLLSRPGPSQAAPDRPVPSADVPDRDPHGTTAGQVEQASEPPVAFGFGVGTVVARET